jgi:hypothetical protein
MGMEENSVSVPVLRCKCGKEMEGASLGPTPREVRCERCGRVWKQWRDENVVWSVLEPEQAMLPRVIET